MMAKHYGQVNLMDTRDHKKVTKVESIMAPSDLASKCRDPIKSSLNSSDNFPSIKERHSDSEQEINDGSNLVY